MEFVIQYVQFRKSLSWTFFPSLYSFLFMNASIFSPVFVVAPVTQLPITSKETSGLPRQFIDMAENILCAILFHLLVWREMGNIDIQSVLVRKPL